MKGSDTEESTGLGKLPLKKNFSVPLTEETTHEFLTSKLRNPAATDTGKTELAAYRAQSSKLFRKRFQEGADEYRLSHASHSQVIQWRSQGGGGGGL